MVRLNITWALALMKRRKKMHLEAIVDVGRAPVTMMTRVAS